MSADRRKSSGRARKPLTGDGPIVELARALRNLIGGTGLTGKQVNHRTRVAQSTQSKALGGHLMPTWSITWALARLDPDADEAYWKELWEAAKAARDAGSARPGTSPARDGPGSALLLSTDFDATIKMSGLPDWRPPRARPSMTAAEQRAAPAAEQVGPAGRPEERVAPARRTHLVGRRTSRLAIAMVVVGTVLASIALAAPPTVAAVIATIAAGSPEGVAVGSDGRTYVTNSTASSVSVIDTSNNTLTAPTPIDSPDRSTVGPEGRTYTINGSVVSVLATSNNTVIGTIPVGEGSNAVATSPDGHRVYVTNYFDDSMAVIDTSSNTVIAAVPTGYHPFAAIEDYLFGTASENPVDVAVSPDGNHVYVANSGSDTVSVIDTRSHTLTAVLPAGNAARIAAIALSPDGRRAYVSRAEYSGPVTASVSVIDTSRR